MLSHEVYPLPWSTVGVTSYFGHQTSAPDVALPICWTHMYVNGRERLTCHDEILFEFSTSPVHLRLSSTASLFPLNPSASSRTYSHRTIFNQVSIAHVSSSATYPQMSPHILHISHSNSTSPRCCFLLFWNFPIIHFPPPPPDPSANPSSYQLRPSVPESPAKCQ